MHIAETAELFARATATGLATAGVALTAWFGGQYAWFMAAVESQASVAAPTWVEGGVVAVLALLIGSLFYFLRENSHQAHQLNLRQIEANEKIAAGQAEVEATRIASDKEKSIFLAQDKKEQFDKMTELVREAYRSKHASEDRVERLQEKLIEIVNRLAPGDASPYSSVSDSTTGKFITKNQGNHQ